MAERRPAGWYADPLDDTRERYWDGTGWREGSRPRSGASAVRSPQTTEALLRRVHALVWVTLGVAVLAAVFGLVAMRAAFDARDEAQRAREAASFADASGDVHSLEQQLRDAGVLPPLDGAP